MPRLRRMVGFSALPGALAGAALLCAAAAPAAAQREAAVEDVLGAVVRVAAEIPADARTARFLGAEREANGVVIDDRGLVLTIGYIILEAMAATVRDSTGAVVPADVLAYDYDTGFGLVRARAPLAAQPMRLGDSGALAAGAPVLVVGAGATAPAFVAARREFAGYWEYLLDDAIFTAPPFPDWAGAALVGADGRLVGVGSLFLRAVASRRGVAPANMFVPIDALKPILGDMLETGRGPGPARPWMGMFTRDTGDGVAVTRVVPDGPAAEAGIVAGEIVAGVGGRDVAGMADLFRKVWALGDAGVDVPLDLTGPNGARSVTLRSADRYDYLKMNPSF